MQELLDTQPGHRRGWRCTPRTFSVTVARRSTISCGHANIYPISLHGVGLSIGSADALDTGHLARLAQLVQMVEPVFVSEHLSWCSINGVHFNDLLPLPYTEEALDHFCLHVCQVQDYLGRKILIENPSSYLRYRHSTIPESEFLTTVSQRTGAGLLLDVNNVFVSACNHHFDPLEYLADVPAEFVDEIHLAGHTLKKFSDGEILIDDHASPVSDGVWSLYIETLKLMGAKPTLIEWDVDLPPLDRLVAEAEIAGRFLSDLHESAA